MRALALVPLLLASPLRAEPVTLTVLSLNVWYGGEQVSFEKTVEAIRAADADVVGLQEPDGNTARLAAAAGYPYVDLRRHILSRVPLFDSALGEHTGTGPAPYSMAALDAGAVHAWALVAPGQVVAVANVHLSSDPYGPDVIRDGGSAADALAAEAGSRVPEVEPFAASLAPLVAKGVPVLVTGDFNAPSWRDWTQAVAGTRPGVPFPVYWPASRRMEAAGFVDAYRAAHPDPVGHPGITYTPGSPAPLVEPGETLDRIDFVWAANASVLGATLLGEEGGTDVGVSVTPWPSDHRGVIATVEAEPAPAPALVAVEPRLVPAGETFLVRVNVPDRELWGVRIVARGGAPEAALMVADGIPTFWRPSYKLSTAGLGPGPYDAVMTDGEGREVARTRFSVVAEDGQPTLSVNDARSGEPIEARWAGAPGFRFDWLGVYAAGESDLNAYLAFVYTGAVLDGATTITAEDLGGSLPPGGYALRLFADDSFVLLAEAPFSITDEPHEAIIP